MNGDLIGRVAADLQLVFRSVVRFQDQVLPVTARKYETVMCRIAEE